MYAKALGSFPDRIKNLYFSYLFLLRAVNKVLQSLLNSLVHFQRCRVRLPRFWQTLIT